MRKPQIQPSLASLTPADREQLADWLRHEDYNVVLERVVKPRPEGLDLDISKKPLQTFYAKVALMDLINARLPENKRFTLAQFECLASADIHLLTSAEQEKVVETHAQILRTTADLASSAQSANELATLQRLADFPARAAVRAQLFECRAQRMQIEQNKEQRAEAKEQRAAEAHIWSRELQTHRIEMDKAHLQLAQSSLQLREEELAHRVASNSQRSTLNSQLAPQSDDLGPFARDWDEISERARIAFNVSKEEWARRQALHETYVDPNPDLNLNPNLSSPSADPAPSTEPPSLPERVNTYNIRRAEEYWAWRSHIASLPNGEPHPQFTTQHRHCPCGQVPSGTPCPEHENETYGEFPGWFWTISPHISAYARCLTHRNLPYRNPDECIPSEFIIS